MKLHRETQKPTLGFKAGSALGQVLEGPLAIVAVILFPLALVLGFVWYFVRGMLGELGRDPRLSG